MRLLIILFLMVFTPVTFSQNEWWRFGKNSETEQEEKKVKEEIEKDTVIAKKETLDSSLLAVDDVWVTERAEPENITPGKINVSKSPSIKKIISFKSATIPPNMGPMMDGFRIQLFFDQSRKAVDKARSEMLELDEDCKTYIEYKAPNYFLLLGDFRTQLTAEKVRSELIDEFPAALVIEDKIYLPEIKTEEEEEEE